MANLSLASQLKPFASVLSAVIEVSDSALLAPPNGGLSRIPELPRQRARFRNLSSLRQKILRIAHSSPPVHPQKT